MEKADFHFLSYTQSLQHKSMCVCVCVCVFSTKSQKLGLYYVVHKDTKPGWLAGGMDGWRDGWVDGWMDGWMDGKTGEWMNGWMDK